MLKFGALMKIPGGSGQLLLPLNQGAFSRYYCSSNAPEVKKAPITAYMRFSSQVRDSVAAQHPGLKLTEISKIIGAKWKQLPEKEKKVFQDAYIKEREQYLASLTPEEIEAKSKALSETRKRNAKKREKKFLADMEKPKKPMEAFFVFSSELRETARDVPVTVFARQTAEKWKSLSEKEKQKYHRMTEVKKKQYEVDMKEWALRMIDQGHASHVPRALLAELYHKPREPVGRALSLYYKDRTGGESVDKAMYNKILKEWNHLSAESKETYSARIEKEKKLYTKNLKAWKATMKEQNQEEIIKLLIKKKTQSPKKGEKSKAESEESEE